MVYCFNSLPGQIYIWTMENYILYHGKVIFGPSQIYFLYHDKFICSSMVYNFYVSHVRMANLCSNIHLTSRLFLFLRHCKLHYSRHFPSDLFEYIYKPWLCPLWWMPFSFVLPFCSFGNNVLNSMVYGDTNRRKPFFRKEKTLIWNMGVACECLNFELNQTCNNLRCRWSIPTRTDGTRLRLRHGGAELITR